MVDDFIVDFDIDQVDTPKPIEDGYDFEVETSDGDSEEILCDFETDGLNQVISTNEHEDSDLGGASELNEHHHNSEQESSISFKGNGKCKVCGCGKWAGHGSVCANCGHFYNKHI